MGGIFWVNDKEGAYFGHEIYLLPNQMLVEHWHVKTETPAKMEAWHLRHGTVYLFGEGAPSPEADQIIPACEKQFATVKHVTKLPPASTASSIAPRPSTSWSPARKAASSRNTPTITMAMVCGSLMR